MTKFDLEFPVEAYITFVDWLKTFITLSTGAIILIVTFLEKMFQNPVWKISIAISLISFFVTVVSSLVAQAGVIEHIDDKKTVGTFAMPLVVFGVIGTVSSFVIGILALLVFALVNIY